MSSLPLVSVIVPTYNYGRFITQALESLQAQTYPNWECFIVDDGSTDNTCQIVAEYTRKDSRIKYVRQKNQRQAAAKNNGISRSCGEYIQFLDADDLIESRKLERQVQYLEQHLDVDIVYGSVRYFHTERADERLYSMWEQNRPWMPNVSGRGRSVQEALYNANIMAINSALVRSSTIDDVGLFDETMPALEDWDYWLRCANQNKNFQYEEAEETRALVRAHPPSLSRDMRKTSAAWFLMQQKRYITSNDPHLLKAYRRMHAQLATSVGIEEVLHGSLSLGVRQLLKASIMADKTRLRLKLLFCALIAPFVSKEQFQKRVSTSMSQSVAGRWRKLEDPGLQ